MAKPFDITKFNKKIGKSTSGISFGFRDPTTWIDTGCYLLNYLISNRFDGGIPLEGKITMLAGDSGCLPETAKVTVRYQSKNTKKFIEEELTVGELKTLYSSELYDIKIDTPDGFQRIINWWDKGFLPMVQLVTNDGFKTTCAVNHPIQLSDETWIFANELVIGSSIITRNGISSIESIETIDEQLCYDFEVDHPNHRYWGDGISSHNSGKSFLATANVIRWCQKNDVWPILIDTENSIDEAWLEKLSVNTSEDAMTKYSCTTVDDASKLIGEFIDNYHEAQGENPYEQRQKVVFIIDSIGMLITPNQEKQFLEGDQKGDMGLKAKQVTNMLRVITGKIGKQPMGLVITNHVFDSQDKYKPDSIPGGKMLEFCSSVIVQMNKYLLKEDEDGKKLLDGAVAGIQTTAVVRKSRYSKPFERMKILIPYDKGMDQYSGLFDLFVAKGVVKKSGNRWTYTSPETGEILTEFRKDYKSKGILDLIMSEWKHWENNTSVGFDETEGSTVNGEIFDE